MLILYGIILKVSMNESTYYFSNFHIEMHLFTLSYNIWFFLKKYAMQLDVKIL